MAPRTEHPASNRGSRSHHARTGAGVNASRSSAAGGRGGPAPAGGRLIDRMTFDDDRRRPAQHMRYLQGRARTQHGRPRRLQDRITYDNKYGGGTAFSRPQGPSLASRMTRDVDDNNSTGTDFHGPSFTGTGTAQPAPVQTAPAQPAPAQSAPAFHTSLLHRVFPDDQGPLFSVTVPGRVAIFARAQARSAIRMINEVPANRPALPGVTTNGNSTGTEATSPRRTVNPYRGKDTLKLLVQNPKLRAILSDKPYPQQRKKSGEERPVLRMGMSRTMK
jgi:hypothetical protein